MCEEVRKIGEGVESLKIAPQVLFPAKAKPGIRFDQKIKVTTNVWSVHPKVNIPVFRYDFRAFEEYPQRKEQAEPVLKEITKQTQDDYIVIDRKNKCLVIYRSLLKTETEFFKRLSALIYDRASILYSLDKLDIEQNEVKTFFVDSSQLPRTLFSEECVRIHVKLQCCTEDFQLTTFDLKYAVNSNPELINRSVQQFYELLLAQEAYFTDDRFVCYGSGESYLLYPDRFGFHEIDYPTLPDGKYVGIGAAKAARIIDGPNNTFTMSLYIDVKKTAFHIDGQNLADKVTKILKRVNTPIDERQLDILNKTLRGLYVKCQYGKFRIFCIAGVTKETAQTMLLEHENVRLVNYFKDHYNITLKYANWPLVFERSQRGNNFYPLELLQVCENQRVTLNQQTSNQIQQMIKACATSPFNRFKQTLLMLKALKLHDNARENRWCKELDMSLSTDSIQLQVRVLHKPFVVYGGSKVFKIKDNASWTILPATKYLIPAVCKRWLVLALVAHSDHFTEQEMKSYLGVMIDRSRQRGLNLSDPLQTSVIIYRRESDLDRQFEQAEKLGATFIHFITSDCLRLHERIKYLECQTQIVTQDLKTSTARNIQRKALTLDNVVQKANLKLGGLNFDLRFDNPEAQRWVGRNDRLILGIDFAFPIMLKGTKQPRVPSVLGYSANCGRHPLEFIGGYRYCWSKRDELEDKDTSMRDIVADTLRAAKSQRVTPNHIIVLRDGISEGQYKYVVEREVEEIKHGCALAGGSRYRPHITVLVITKQHNLRIYRQGITERLGVCEQNIPAGTVLDEKIVNPLLYEFFLNSHCTLQGTAKTPKYNVLFDTAKMSSDELQTIVYALAYDLQIVTQSCSLPAPVIIADQMAGRGRNNFLIRYGEPHKKRDYDLESLNSELGYLTKRLGTCRFGA